MRNRLLRIISAIAAFVMTSAASFSAFAAVLSNFTQVNYYGPETYYDVSADDWYNGYVGFVYDYGIMTGTDKRAFSPNGKLTLAEAITVAARLNATFYGNAIDPNPQNIRLSAASGADISRPVSGDAGFVVSSGDISGPTDLPRRPTLPKRQRGSCLIWPTRSVRE